MAKSARPFDDDFEQLARHVDQAARFLPSDSREGSGSGDGNCTFGDRATKELAIGGSKKPKARRTAAKTVPSAAGETQKSPVEWGSPTALFNPRIPQSMSDQLDDLAYKLKKAKVQPATKQALAQEALEDLLRKHGMLRP